MLERHISLFKRLKQLLARPIRRSTSGSELPELWSLCLCLCFLYNSWKTQDSGMLKTGSLRCRWEIYATFRTAGQPLVWPSLAGHFRALPYYRTTKCLALHQSRNSVLEYSDTGRKQIHLKNAQKSKSRLFVSQKTKHTTSTAFSSLTTVK